MWLSGQSRHIETISQIYLLTLRSYAPGINDDGLLSFVQISRDRMLNSTICHADSNIGKYNGIRLCDIISPFGYIHIVLNIETHCGWNGRLLTLLQCHDYSCSLIGKSKDYVYGIWVYKVLDIWKDYYRVKKITSFMQETVNRGKKL